MELLLITSTLWPATGIASTLGVEFSPESMAPVTTRKFPNDLRARARALARTGPTITNTSPNAGITHSSVYGWMKQDRIDPGETKGVSRAESRELRRAKRRIRDLEKEGEILQRAGALLGSLDQHPTESTR